LKNGMEIMPTSFLLHFYYTELQEQRQKSAEARSAFESLISHLNSEIERIEESAEEAIANVNKAGEAAKEEFSGMELDGEMREQLRTKEKERDKERAKIEETKKKEIDAVAKGVGLVCIMYMRFARRSEV